MPREISVYELKTTFQERSPEYRDEGSGGPGKAGGSDSWDRKSGLPATTSHIAALPTGEPFHGPLSIGTVGRAHWPVRAELL